MAGAAYLIYGNSAGEATTTSLSDADKVYVGENAGDYAGYNVAGAGDLDGDGLGDFFIGAPYNDDGATDAGKVYLVME